MMDLDESIKIQDFEEKGHNNQIWTYNKQIGIGK
jgi:hypothetical protein